MIINHFAAINISKEYYLLVKCIFILVIILLKIINKKSISNNIRGNFDVN